MLTAENSEATEEIRLAVTMPIRKFFDWQLSCVLEREQIDLPSSIRVKPYATTVFARELENAAGQ